MKDTILIIDDKVKLCETLAKTFGQFGEDLQVLLVGVLWHQQHEQQRNGLAVRRIKRNRGTQAQQGTGRFLESLDAAVRDGNPQAQPGRAEFFPGEQAVEDGTAGDSLMVLEKQSGVLEDTFLARDIKIKHDVFDAEELGDLAHT